MTAPPSEVILPIWPGDTKKQVIGHPASLADKLARGRSTRTAGEIASEIVEVMRLPELARG